MPHRSLFGSMKHKFSTSRSEKEPLQQSSQSRVSPQTKEPSQGLPPAYSPVPTDHLLPGASTTTHHSTHPPRPRSRGASPIPNLANVTSDDDKYAFLTTFDTIFLIDDSASMRGSNWKQVETALRSITPICTSHDQDGIDIYFLNHKSASPATSDRPAGGYHNVTSPAMVERVFATVPPSGATPLGSRLHSILKPYISSLQTRPGQTNEDVKPINIIVITDGCPTDDPEGVIVQHARKLDTIEAPPYQVGIQFFQVGSDRGASEYLRELDDELAGQGVRDMVDATGWDGEGSGPASAQQLTADGILKVVLGAVVRRLDRKSTTNKGRSRS